LVPGRNRQHFEKDFQEEAATWTEDAKFPTINL